jgi:adenosylcobyric acid synthase
VEAIKRHLRYGGKLLGICGGFQMLGKTIADPHGIESDVTSFAGMGFLDMETVLEEHKQLRKVVGTLAIHAVPVRGYEIHMGVSKGPALQSPFVLLGNRADGALSRDGQIAGTYLHGIFDEKEACAAILSWAGLASAQHNDFQKERLRNIDSIADLVEQNVDLKALDALINLSPAPVNSLKTT